MDIKLIAFDLDGTLLTTDKRLSDENRSALKRAADRGIELVPCTGRFYLGMPEAVRELSFINYAIIINGAQVLDIKNNYDIYSAVIPFAQAMELIDHCDGLGTAYDCYFNNRGYMSGRYYDHIEDYLPDPIYCETIKKMRTPVDDVRDMVRSLGTDVQKIQLFSGDRAFLKRTCDEIINTWDGLIATSSLKNNLEINNENANKGAALKVLAEHLGLKIEQTMAIGDGGNDESMLDAAGISVVMGNGLTRLKEKADIITLNCDENGVAEVINSLLDGTLKTR